MGKGGRTDNQMNDLLALIERDTSLKKVAGTNGGEWAGSCPFCGGRDRFRVWPNADKPHCWCRVCGFHGDAVSYLMRRDNLNFGEAATLLSIERQRPRKQKARLSFQRSVNTSDLKPATCFDRVWQHSADVFVTHCAIRLQRDWKSSNAGKYLEQRGICCEAAGAVDLGVNGSSYSDDWGGVRVWLPRGIVIPWQIPSLYWNIRVRRPNGDLKDGDSKYISPAGVSNGLYNAHLVTPRSAVVMVEGELDAILINWQLHRAGMTEVLAVATGGTTGSRLVRWVTLVTLAQQVLLAFDADDSNCAGDRAAEW